VFVTSGDAIDFLRYSCSSTDMNPSTEVGKYYSYGTGRFIAVFTVSSSKDARF
jgi:hypothetical protein